MIKGLIGGICGLIVMAGAGWAAAVTYINTDGGRLAEKYLQPFGGKGKVQYGSVEKAMFSGDVIIRNIRIQMPDGRKVRIARVLVRRYDWLGAKKPAFADVAMDSVVADAAVFGPMVEAQAAKAGLKNVNASIRYAYDYDADTRQLRVETIRISLKDLGDLTLSATFAGMPRPEFTQSGLIRTLAQSKIARATAVFSDKSLAKRLVQTYGAANGIEAGAAKQALLKDLAAQQRTARNSLLKEMYAAARSYIEKPGRIMVDIKPARPVRLTTLAPVFLVSPREVKRMLALKIRTSSASE